MSDFARNQLLKYGWTEGKGLGKNENGIINAVKPTLKFDTAGVGHETKEYNWWDYVYNKAASNLTVNNDIDGEGVVVKVKDKNAVKIKSSKPNPVVDKLKEDNGLVYKNFIKTAKFEDGKTSTHSDFKVDLSSDMTDDPLPNVIMNDEELFKACNGRTAHKGARHGLTLNGKLERIKRQESLLVNNITMNHDDWIKVEKKKKKKNRKESMDNHLLSSANNNNNNNNNIINNNNNICSSSSSSRNNNNNNDFSVDSSEINHNLNNNNNDSFRIIIDNDDDDYLNHSVKSKKSKKKEKRKMEDLSQQLSDNLDVSQKKKLKVETTSTANIENVKTKKKKSNYAFDELVIQFDKTNETNRLNGKIKKKKLKKLEKKNSKKMKFVLESMKTLDIKKDKQN